jgi:hypothetical protein
MGGEKGGENRVSCNRASVQTGQAATTVGVPGGSTKPGYTTGVLLNAATRTLDQVGQAAAPAVNTALRLIAPTGPQATRQRMAAGRLLGSAVIVGARLAGVAPVLAKVKLAVAVSDLVTSRAGTAKLSLNNDACSFSNPNRWWPCNDPA